MQEIVKEICKKSFKQSMEKIEKQWDKMHIPWTLAPQKSLVEMLNGVWKPPKVLVVSASPSPPLPTNSFAKWHQKNPFFLFLSCRLVVWATFSFDSRGLLKKHDFYQEVTTRRFFKKSRFLLAEKSACSKNCDFGDFFARSRRFFQGW